MPRVAPEAFERLPLRVHTFMAGVPLHDLWAVDLLRWRSGVTLADFLRAAHDQLFTPSRPVRLLLGLRFFVGRLLGWDRAPATAASPSFAARLTVADRAQSLAAAGAPDGFFHIVYRFEHEQLVEIVNRTVHAAALSALVATPAGYRFYFGVYVRSVSRWTPLYMALIGPVRRFLVYPSLLRSVRARWNRVMGGGELSGPRAVNDGR